MIIIKAPLRISFAGGGTDLEEFYKSEPGSVISTTIDKFIYITVKKPFNNNILLRYSKIEEVEKIDDIENELFRECLRLLNITKGIEINSMADIPAKTGAGSSSTFIVALLHALHTYKGEHVSQEQLAREAYHIEVGILKRPIGKQDHYASAYGGLNFIEFRGDDSVFVNPVVCKSEILKKLDDNLMLFYTCITRNAADILSEQKQKTEDKRETLRKMKILSEKIRDSIIAGDLDKFASLLHEAWLEKRKVTEKISSPFIDECYNKAINAGAMGGKLLGAGGGGFLLFYCERDKQDKVRLALGDLKEVKFNLEKQGSRIISVH